MHGLSFLTPLAALVALAVAVPLAALLATERRAARIRRTLLVPEPRRAAVVPVAASLLLLGVLVGVAAAQPVVVRERRVSERADAQAFFLFDTSLSMQAAGAPGRPSRLARAKRIALRLRAALPDVPVGIASMTDRALPNLMPTADAALFARTLAQAVAVDRPPPSQAYPGRATRFQALVPLAESVYTPTVRRRLLVVFTDGEATPLPSYLADILRQHLTPLYVHVWASGERIFGGNGAPDRRYEADPESVSALDGVAVATGGRQAFAESDVRGLARAARSAVGIAGKSVRVDSYARIPLAPWVALGGVLPLGFLLWRRNL